MLKQDEYSQDEQPAEVVWGKLLPYSPNHHVIGSDIVQLDWLLCHHFLGAEMTDDEYTFGRHESCSIKYTDPAISNIHCTIKRVQSLVCFVRGALIV